MTQKNIRFSENTVLRLDDYQTVNEGEASSIVMPERVIKQMEKLMAQEEQLKEEIQSNKSIFANLKPLETL